MKNIETCPICDSTETEPFLSCKDHLVSKETFSIVRCKSCDFRFTNPIPDEDRISDYYKSEEYISHTNTNKSLISKVYQKVRTISLRKKEKLLLRNVSRGTLLDFGCGTGHFLNYAKQAGWKVFGVEPDSGARAIAKSNTELVFEDKDKLENQFPSEQFDAITLWHVLEHLTNLKESLHFFNNKLKQKGILVIAVPNYLSYDSKFYGGSWAAYDVPRHLYHFEINTIKKLLSKSGFTFEKVKPMYFDSVYVSMLSEKNRYGKIHYLRAIIVGLISNLKAVLSGNYSSRIYIFKKS